GIGDNGCEYMTGGTVVILGEIGENFAAGMSGGVAYIYTKNSQETTTKINHELVNSRSTLSAPELAKLKQLIEQHANLTRSEFAQEILSNWEDEKANFIFVIPNEYEMMLTRITSLEQTGKTHDEAELQAFYEHKDGKLIAGVAK
ncbi:hypothetical protein O3R05_002889, partial [Listeria innocua]|nr:hypothetical protein [Listeria innocua]EKG5270705.1 hypothetical protein [Listeria innocua]